MTYWSISRYLGGIFGYFESYWDVLEASWCILEASWRHLGASWRRLGASWRRPGRSWGHLEGILEAMVSQDEPRYLQDRTKIKKAIVFFQFLRSKRRLQDAPKTAQDASKSHQDASKSLQDAAKTLPRDAKKLHFPLCFQWFRIPGPSWH